MLARSFWTLILLSLTLPTFAAPNQAWLLTRLHMVTPTVGWAMGETLRRVALLKTEDGGRHWTEALNFGLTPDDGLDGSESVGLAFRGTKTAWAASNVVHETPEAYSPSFKRVAIRIEQTQDGGRYWRQSRIIPLAQDETGWLTLDFPDGRHGYLLEDGDTASGSLGKTIYRTTDAGMDWVKVSAASFFPYSDVGKHPLPLSGSPTGISFFHPRDGWVTFSTTALPDDYLYQTADGGCSWRQRLLRLPRKYHGYTVTPYPPVFFGRDKRNGLLPVRFFSNPEVFTLYITQDGGKHWRGIGHQGVPDGEAATCFFINIHDGWIVDSRQRLYATHDSGRHWAALSSDPAFEPKSDSIRLDFLTPQLGWALVEKTNFQTSDRTSELRETQDGGRHWNMVYHYTLPNLLRRRSKFTLKLPHPPTMSGIPRK